MSWRFAEIATQWDCRRARGILTGDGSTGSIGVKSRDVDKICVSPARRRWGGRSAKATVRPQETSLELGGKSPFIIFEERISTGRWKVWWDGNGLNRGKCAARDACCDAGSFAEKMTRSCRARMSTLRVGAPLEQSVISRDLAAGASSDAKH